MSYYLALEIEGIQRFVFAPPQLVDVRGGSALLDRFNRQDMVKAIKGAHGKIIFTGGGHCLASGFPSCEAAKKVATDLDQRLRRGTDSQVSLSWGIAEACDDFQVVRRALEASRRKHAGKPLAAPASLPPFVALCDACGQGAAVELKTEADADPMALCQACLARRNASTLLRDDPATRPGRRGSPDEMGDSDFDPYGSIWQRLRGFFPGSDSDYEQLIPHMELAQMLESASGNQYLAFLYCDGNAMGRARSGLRTAEQDRHFSLGIDKALHFAVAHAIQGCASPSKGGGGGSPGKPTFGAQILMLGGDDLIVALRADRAAEFTSQVLEHFYRWQETHQTDPGRELLPLITLSAGLVFAGLKTPITLLQMVAQDLLKSAKRRAYLDDQLRAPAASHHKGGARSRPDEQPPSPSRGYIDFQEITASQVDVERESVVSCRPYRHDEGTELERGIHHGAYHYYVMELVLGGHLEQRVRARKPT